MLTTIKYTLFGIGTAAFFVAVYLAINYPELTQEPAEGDESHRPRMWDQLATWVMWLGWGGAALLTFVDRSGLLRGMDD